MTNGVNNEVYEEIIEDAPVVEVPYGDLYLKFADEASANTALFDSVEVEAPVMKDVQEVKYLMQGVPDADGIAEDYMTFDEPTEGKVVLDSWVVTSQVFDRMETQIQLQPKYQGMAIDVIGTITTIDNTDPENPVVTELPGWHVNTRGPMPEALKAFAVVPTQPRRTWA
jgi:hypothetical protein